MAEAAFVPPPPEDMKTALYDFEKFMHAGIPLPMLVQCALVHAQFETIHPFLDGNGRVGRPADYAAPLRGGAIAASRYCT